MEDITVILRSLSGSDSSVIRPDAWNRNHSDWSVTSPQTKSMWAFMKIIGLCDLLAVTVKVSWKAFVESTTKFKPETFIKCDDSTTQRWCSDARNALMSLKEKHVAECGGRLFKSHFLCSVKKKKIKRRLADMNWLRWWCVRVNLPKEEVLPNLWASLNSRFLPSLCTFNLL